MIAILFAFVLPFLILILTLILKRDGETLEPNHASGPGKSNSSGNTSNEGTKQKTSSHHRKSRDKRKYIFDWDASEFKSENETLYTAALSVVALFSWVMRKDGNASSQEMDVVRYYFSLHHTTYYRILSHPPLGMTNDPVTGIPRFVTKDYMKMLEYYNALPKLLRHGKCCGKILEAGIYYEAALDLLKALFQVAYSSDGVIEPEMDILRSIALGLNIHLEDWNNLRRKYEIYRESNKNRMDSSSESSDEMGKKSNKKKKKNRRNRQEWNESENSSGQYEERKEQQQGQEQHKGKNQKKSSTFGYKLTQAYNQLGLLTTATEPEIKAAFRQLAKKYHPDRLPSDATDMERKISADQFRQVMEAYDYIRLERGM